MHKPTLSPAEQNEEFRSMNKDIIDPFIPCKDSIPEGEDLYCILYRAGLRNKRETHFVLFLIPLATLVHNTKRIDLLLNVAIH